MTEKTEKTDNTRVLAGADANGFIHAARAASKAETADAGGEFVSPLAFTMIELSDDSKNIAHAIVTGVAARRGAYGGTALRFQVVMGSCEFGGSELVKGSEFALRTDEKAGVEAPASMRLLSEYDATGALLGNLGIAAPKLDADAVLGPRPVKVPPAPKASEQRSQRPMVVIR